MQMSQLLMGTVASVFLLATSARCDEEVARVEQFGNPSNWHLLGVESFDPEDVKRALSRDFDVVLAGQWLPRQTIIVSEPFSSQEPIKTPAYRQPPRRR